MLIDWIDSPALPGQVDNESDLVARCREVVAQIGEIAGDLPTYLDLGSIEGWNAEIEVALAKTTKLIADGLFHSVDTDAVERVRAWASDPAVIENSTRDARVAHADLRCDQVLVTPHGYRILDWQRPVIVSPDLDLVSMLLGENIDAAKHVDPRSVGLFWMLRLGWAAEAQYDLFPEFRGPLFNNWAAEAVNKILQ
jgi:hypothetical protein